MPIFRSATGHDAAATLLRTTHTVAMTSPSVPGIASADSTEYVSTVTDRLGDLIIEDGEVSRIVTENGFAHTDGGSFDYCFYVTDHQGNNRMVIDENGAVHRIEHYYPFGLSFEVTNFTAKGTTSRRSFGGKEFDRTSGLDLYDQEARQYDPALLRFTRPDDLGDKYPPLSPFAFCLNNPVLLTDPSGEIVIAKTSDEQEMITSTINEYDRKHVEFDDNGVLNTTKLLDNISASGNYGALIALAVSVIEVNIVLDDKFISKNNIGEISETPMGTIDYDDYYKKDTPIAPKDIVTGETGRSGITCLPGIGESGINSTHDCKIYIVVNIALSDNGRAQALSHEAYGHAAMYVRTKNRKMSRHEFRNTNIDHNFLLSKEIQRAILETISIQKK